MFKKICSLGLLVWIMAGSFMTYAQEPIEVTIQPWAKSDLLTAEVSGLVPNNYYEQLNKPITQNQLEQIVEGFKRQCIQASLIQKEETFIIQAGTRQQVLSTYYNVLKGFEGKINLDKDMVSYMQSNGVIKGDAQGNLSLEKVCTVQDAIIFANRIITDLYKQTEAGTRGFLWEVSDENNTVYLLGSIHLGRQEIYPFSTKLNSIIEKSDKLAFEVDFNNQRGQVYFEQKQMYLDDTTLQDHLDEETYVKTIEAFKQYGMNEETIKKFKPWALSNALTTLMVNAEDDINGAISTLPAVDLYVYTKALLADREILEIEGYNFQADLFDGLDEAYQIESLKMNLDELESKSKTEVESIGLVDEWVNQFIKGDIKEFTLSYGKDQALEQDDLMMKALFKGRDDRMTKKVVEYLGDKDDATYLVTVGAGHMIGDTGIISQLEKLGYTVNMVGEN